MRARAEPISSLDVPPEAKHGGQIRAKLNIAAWNCHVSARKMHQSHLLHVVMRERSVARVPDQGGFRLQSSRPPAEVAV